MGSERVQAFYDEQVESEWTRMDRHRMEFANTLRAMEEFIPARSDILDIGGGPGRYSITLAKARHRVTLFDLSQRNVEFAHQKADEARVELEGYRQGNALHLEGLADQTFDVVLLMGPLYHLVDVSQRQQALSEALRVLRPGGILFASFITRYAFILDVLKRDPGQLVGAELIDRLLTGGVRLVGADADGFTEAYFADPDEIEPWFVAAGLQKLRLAAVDPLVMPVEQTINDLPPDVFKRWVDLCYRLGTQPHVWGSAEHMLYVGRKQ